MVAPKGIDDALAVGQTIKVWKGRESGEFVDKIRNDVLGESWGKLPLQTQKIESEALFPIDALPPAMRRACEEVARFSKVPVSSPAIVALTVAAVALGKRAKVEEKKGLEHYPAIFFVGIAGSGQRKSDSFRLLQSALTEWQDRMTPEYERVLAIAKAKNKGRDEIVRAMHKELVNSAENFEKLLEEIAQEELKRESLPVRPRLFSTDITEPNLFQKMDERSGTFSILTSEGRPIIDSIMGKYQGDGKTGDSIYLAGISGDTISRDRVGNSNDGGEDRLILDPCLSVCALVQPDKYLEVSTNRTLRESGFLARIWPVAFKSMVGYRIEEEDEVDLQTDSLLEYSTVISDLLKFRFGEMGLQGDESECHLASLSSAARLDRRCWFNEIESKQRENGEFSDVKDYASKIVSSTCKLALILHIFENSRKLEENTSEISIETWKQARTIGEFCFAESVRLQRMSEDGIEKIAAHKFLEWLKSKKYFAFRVSDIINLVPRPRKAAHLHRLCSVLIEENWMRANHGDNQKSPKYELHPELAKLANQPVNTRELI